MHQTLWKSLVLACGLTLVLAGCPKKNPVAGPDASAQAGLDASNGSLDGGGAGDGSTNGNLDGGTADTGPSVKPCSVDDDCPADQRCSEAGACMPALPCDDPSNCPNDQDPKHEYCDNVIGLGCRCVIPAGQTKGYCKRRLPPCAPCTTDEQCGNDPLYFTNAWHEPGHCVTLDGAQVCLEYFVTVTPGVTKCPCGQSVVIGAKNYCAPQGSPASCTGGEFLCCTTDGNCPPEHPLCSGGLCKDICWYDFQKDETIGCRADKVCDVDPTFLTPGDKNYGAGSCSSPCTDDAECQGIRGDFVCRSEPKSDKRCRPQGCIDDYECLNPEQDPSKPTFPFIGFCERSTGVCQCHDPTDSTQACSCRVGNNPVNNTAYKDCRDGYKCNQPTPGAPGVCIEKNCIENGGSHNICGWGQFCCGEDRDHTGTAPPCVDLAGTTIIGDFGKCYAAPNPPWCMPCATTLADGTTPDWTTCSKPGYPGTATDTNICNAYDKGANGKDRGNMCYFACIASSQCPQGFTCTDQGWEVDCSSDPTVCGDTSRCKWTGKNDPQSGAKINWCSCSTAGVKGGECPSLDPTDATAPVSRCSDVNSPFYHCIWTHACKPNGQVCQAQ